MHHLPDSSLRRFVSEPSRSPMVPPFLLAMVMSCVAGLCFLALSYEVARADTGAVDDAVLHAIGARTASWSVVLPTDVTFLGSTLAITSVTLLVVAALVWRRRVFDAIFLGIAVGGSATLAFAIKHMVARPRPTAFPRIPESGYSFPSGHMMSFTCVALACAYLICCSAAPRGVKIGASVLLVVGSTAVGASRLVLGVHYPTDIIASLLLGIAWIAALVALRHGVGDRAVDRLGFRR